jgi:hypothetical protein
MGELMFSFRGADDERGTKEVRHLLDETIVLVRAARTLKSFVEYVDGAGPASLLAEIELRAAAAAFANLRITIDQKSQLWNAVNHLETAWQAELSNIRRGSESWGNAFLVHKVRLRGQANRAKLIGHFLALCYKLLGEERLVNECLGQLATLSEVGYLNDGPSVKEFATNMFIILTIPVQMPVAGIAIAMFDENKYISQGQINDLEAILKSNWS